MSNKSYRKKSRKFKTDIESHIRRIKPSGLPPSVSKLISEEKRKRDLRRSLEKLP